MRSEENLWMNGQEVFAFTLKRVPEVVRALIAKSETTMDCINWFIFHQANAFMNGKLCNALKIPEGRAPLFVEEVGNTVSNTIPITLQAAADRMRDGDLAMLVGFGVGYSWGACMLEWSNVFRKYQ